MHVHNSDSYIVCVVIANMKCVYVFALFALVVLQVCHTAPVPEDKKEEVATDPTKVVDPSKVVETPKVVDSPKVVDPAKVVAAVEHVEVSPEQSHVDDTPAKVAEEKATEEKKA
ncbi:hypothetical protein evm_001996 [Chilo suppressalis]|nr:hypothetical protein evm_001996 [Chilo suppressalis]